MPLESGGNLSTHLPTFPTFPLSLSFFYFPSLSVVLSLFVFPLLIYAFYLFLQLVLVTSMGNKCNFNCTCTSKAEGISIHFFSSMPIILSTIAFMCLRKIVLGVWHGYYIQKRRRRKSFCLLCMLPSRCIY